MYMCYPLGKREFGENSMPEYIWICFRIYVIVVYKLLYAKSSNVRLTVAWVYYIHWQMAEIESDKTICLMQINVVESLRRHHGCPWRKCLTCSILAIRWLFPPSAIWEHSLCGTNIGKDNKNGWVVIIREYVSIFYSLVCNGAICWC